MLNRGVFLLAGTFLSAPALAGDEVLYEDTPDWVVQAEVDPATRSSNSVFAYAGQQARIEDGQLWTYVETVIALDSPEALTQFGTLSAAWLPDKGDLRIHRAELLRENETIDLLDGDKKFEVLRRERRLEQRMLDGSLTATMTIAGAQLGDLVRLAYSTTLQDQAMGENVQWQAGLPALPAPIEDGRISVSWPKGMEVSRKRLGNADVLEPEVENGFMVWSADLPVAKADELPGDAPIRYLIGELMQVSTYHDWQSVSSHMAPHYDVTEAIAPGSVLEQEVANIAATSGDELTRVALALQLVQDKISYLLNGLNGGNYLPQSPQETWEKRFGDCKAKSVLLLALLRELGVDAEVVLVRTNGGDALPMMAPMPGNFDHMIVKADIGGETYWLDGTSSGGRLDTIAEIPRFHYALPLREEGAELVKMGERPKTTPDGILRLSMDQSAGIRLPALIEVEFEYRGSSGAGWRTLAEQGNKDRIRDAVSNAIAGAIGETIMVDHSLSYDDETGVALLKGNGILSSPWKKDRATYEFAPPVQAAKDVTFASDRARAEWRDIPLRLNGPIYWTSEFEVRLPENDAGFELEGATDVSEVIGGVEVTSQAELDGNRFALSQSMRSVLDELPANAISPAKRNLARFHRALPTLRSPQNIRQLWDYFGEGRALLEPLEKAYAKAIAKAKPDDSTALVSRAALRFDVFDYAGTLEDVNAALEIEASRDLYWSRAWMKRHTGDLEGALADMQLAEDLEPDGSTYADQIEILAHLDRTEEALALAEDYRGLAKTDFAEAEVMSAALGWSGEIEEGLDLLEQLKARRPGDGSLLNAICWYTATWNIVNEERMQTCVEAVEKSDYSAAALDSRALAHFRLGNLDAAMADLDAALLADPGQSASRLIRGIVRVANGDREGREEIRLALAMNPSIEANYKAWGLEF